jgi:hypothetical protein
MPELVRVRASDFAKFTGHNKFVTREEAAALFWQRNLKVAEAHGISVEPEATEIERDFRKSSLPTQAAVKETLCLSADAPVESVVRAVHEKIVAPLAKVETTAQMTAQLDILPTQLGAVRSTIEREAQKMRGTLREDASINKIEQETGRAVGRRNTQYYQKTLPLARTDIKVIIAGMLDGRFDDDGGIVEAKERRNRLFGFVVPYEMLQLHCYMFLTGTTKATLVERLDEQSERYEVAFSDEFWRDSLDKFERFLEDCIPLPQQQQQPPPSKAVRRPKSWPARTVSLRSDAICKRSSRRRSSV